MIKMIYILRFTNDDGKTWKDCTGEFFTRDSTAIAKAKRFNVDLGELSRYEIFPINLSWDEPE